MSQNQSSNSQKSLRPDNLEDKALKPSTEDKAVSPSVDADPGLDNVSTPQPAPAAAKPDDKVKITVAHPIPKGRIGNDEALRPGDETSVTKYLANSLVQQGVARLA